ncbi:MAG: hypothetical protein IJX47_05815 [Clostridia bacterium]|nr:hypothetical protein [Clostridia bacterium]
MLQFFFEITVAVLAVYGGYTALHELVALICKWIGAPRYTSEINGSEKRKEDSDDGRDEGSDHAGGDD